jgi:hypothetical protein
MDDDNLEGPTSIEFQVGLDALWLPSIVAPESCQSMLVLRG